MNALEKRRLPKHDKNRKEPYTQPQVLSSPTLSCYPKQIIDLSIILIPLIIIFEYPSWQILSIFLGLCKAVREFHKHDPPQAHNDIKVGFILKQHRFLFIVNPFISIL